MAAPVYHLADLQPDDHRAHDDHHDDEREAPQDASGVVLERVGLGYRMRFPAAAAIITLSRIRESRGRIEGELSVRCELPELVHPGEQLAGRFDASSFTVRKTTAGILVAKTRGASIGWDRILEVFCQAVLGAEREGEPIVLVGRAPRRAMVEHVLAPLIEAGQPTILYGAGGTGKTTLAAAAAVSIATGIEIIAGFRPTQGQVLVLDWERSADDWNELVAAVAAGAGIDPPEIGYRYCGGRSLADQIEEVARYVTTRGTRCLIVDSVGHATGAQRDGSDANEGALRLFAGLRALKVAALLIDHIAGADLGVERPTSKPYGSVYKINGAQGGVFELRRERSTGSGPGHVALIDTKRNLRAPLAPIGLRIEYEGDPATAIRFVREDVTSPDLTAALTLAERIEIALREAMVALEPKDIAERINAPADQVRAALAKWKDRRFRRLSDGRWGLATHAA